MTEIVRVERRRARLQTIGEPFLEQEEKDEITDDQRRKRRRDDEERVKHARRLTRSTLVANAGSVASARSPSRARGGKRSGFHGTSCAGMDGRGTNS